MTHKSEKGFWVKRKKKKNYGAGKKESRTTRIALLQRPLTSGQRSTTVEVRTAQGVKHYLTGRGEGPSKKKNSPAKKTFIEEMKHDQDRWRQE